MTLIEEIAFTHEGKDLDIKVFQDSDIISVKVFENNKPVGPITYSVKIDTNFDYYVQNGKAGYKELIEIAKRDFIEKSWIR